MARKGSWKAELDRKYNRLMNRGSIELIDKANDAILKAIEELDRIEKYQREIILVGQHRKSYLNKGG